MFFSLSRSFPKFPRPAEVRFRNSQVERIRNLHYKTHRISVTARAPFQDEPRQSFSDSDLFPLHASSFPEEAARGVAEQTRLSMHDWVSQFLGMPHPDLHAPDPNRPVCPYVPAALRSGSIWMRVIEDTVLTEKTMRDIVMRSREEFLEMEPRQGQGATYKAIILAFPHLDSSLTPVVIDGIQRKLKINFVRQGLMLGEFHEANNTPGLHNPSFFPLRTPVPALAIRFMVQSDVLFLQDSMYTSAERIEFLNAFLRQDFNANVEEAKQALTEAYREQGRQISN